jgi:Tetratricopeptide repeat
VTRVIHGSGRRLYLAICLLVVLTTISISSGAARKPAKLIQSSEISSKGHAQPRTNETERKYVGAQACASCHRSLYDSFRKTAMGQSMLPGDALTSALPVPATIYDKDSNQYLSVTSKDGQLFQSEYFLDVSGNKQYQQSKKIDYVIGAGEDGFGFLVQMDHYLFEAPLSYYTTSHSWGFAPGYEIKSRGFTRPILDRCILCHSGRPNPVAGQVGLYKNPPFDELSVGCENCHGPGEAHVLERSQDQMTGVEPPLGNDPTIVNPALLSGWLADNICMRCHQGQDVRMELPSTNLQDFRPGQELGKYIAIFKIALEPGASPSALPLEHYFGMTLSKCYRSSGNLHCITCHDPHVASSAPDSLARYRSQCLRCHGEQGCKLEPKKRNATSPPDNCLTCHMPKRPVTTIAHAALTDHSIPAHASSTEVLPQRHANEKPELLLLSALPEQWNRLDSVPAAVLLQAYDSLVREGRNEFEPMLAQALLRVSASTTSDPAVLRVFARAEFRKNTPTAMLTAIESMKRVFRLTPPNVDDYLLLGNLYSRTKRPKEAIQLLEEARRSNPYFREIYELLAQNYMALGQFGDALSVTQQGLRLFPDDANLRTLEEKAKAVDLGPLN